MLEGPSATICETVNSDSFRKLLKTYCYLIIRNAEASLVEIKSRDRHYKRMLIFLRSDGCNMNVNSAFSRNIVRQIPTLEK